VPFENEFATGESLLSLEAAMETSRAFKEFHGKVRVEAPTGTGEPLRVVSVQRRNWDADARDRDRRIHNF
jgi:hypothetical protein